MRKQTGRTSSMNTTPSARYRALLRAGFAGSSLFFAYHGASATETENRGLRVLTAPGAVKVDGKISDWDLSGGVFACGQVEHLRDKNSVWVHAMSDAENLYLLARWKDPTPLNNPESLGGHGFNGDCFQFRFEMFPDSPDKTVTWWDAWRDKEGRSVVGRAWPGPRNGVPGNPVANLPNATEQGVLQAFQVDEDKQGYAQELAIPWKMLSVSGRAPEAGSSFRFTVEPNFTAGAFGRITIKDIFNDQSKSPDRIFTFRAYKDWGQGTMVADKKVDPQPVRLADARTFPVSMNNGVPVVDWTGLIKRFEWPGFKSISFNMPFKGYASLNILDEKGRVVRHLLNQDAREAGPVTVQWDGLTDATYRTPGQPVPAGNYTWKALVHPGATLAMRGWAGFSGKAPYQATPEDFWLGDHGVPMAAVTDGKRMYLACNGAEGGRHLIATDFQGKLLWSLQNTTGAADPNVIAVADNVVYVVHPGVAKMKSGALLSRVDANTGAYQPWEGTKSHILERGQVFPDAKETAFVGLDAHKGLLYGTTGSAVVLLDGKSGALRRSIALPQAAAIKVQDANTAYVICGEELRRLNLADGSSTVLVAGLKHARSLTLDAAGRLLVSLGEPAHQVVCFDTTGKELSRVGQAGGRGLGPWQKERMFQPTGMAVDPEGKLWVMEADENPKRVSVWNVGIAGPPTGSSLWKEYFGPTHYGASGGAINPRDPNLMIGEGCEWRIDPQGGPAECVGTFERNLHSFATYREGPNGRLYLATTDMRYGVGKTTIRERLGDANFVVRAELRNDVPGQDPKIGKSVLWTDLNGDGQESPDELQEREGALYTAGSNSWSLNIGPNLSLVALDFLDRKLKVLTPSFHKSGAPVYNLGAMRTLPDAMSTGYERNYSCALPSADNKTVLVNLKTKGQTAGDFTWHCFDLASGELKWTYPNPYFQVHGSHRAPAPDPGLFRGAYGPIGAVDQPGVGPYWIINGNLGEWWALSSDGFYLSRIFNGNVFDWVWPSVPSPGTDFTNLPSGSGGEDFGGSVTQGKDGQVYLQAGKAGLWNVALSGLDKAVNIPGQAFALTEADTRKALALREASLQASAAGGRLTVKPATVKFTGNVPLDFKTSEQISFKKTEDAAVKAALAYDATHLYVGWTVADSTPWVNGARDISQMYAAGDTVDLQLGTDPAARADRSKAVPGDIRVSIGNLNGKPTAVLYRFVSAEKRPRIFTSGVVQGWQVDYVDIIADAEIQVKLNPGKGYSVEAALPLEALGLRAAPQLSIRGDVGVTHGDAAGERTRLRTYWSNQETGLVDDVVLELQPAPRNWGEFRFE